MIDNIFNNCSAGASEQYQWRNRFQIFANSSVLILERRKGLSGANPAVETQRRRNQT